MSRKDFSQQFPSPQQFSETSFPTPTQLPETSFPTPEEFEVYSTPPEDVFPVFQPENVFLNTPPVNNPIVNTPAVNNPAANSPQVDLENNPFGLSEASLRQLEQDEENYREIMEQELREEAARREQEAREAQYLRDNYFDIMETKLFNGEFYSSSSDEGWNSDDSYS